MLQGVYKLRYASPLAAPPLRTRRNSFFPSRCSIFLLSALSSSVAATLPPQTPKRLLPAVAGGCLGCHRCLLLCAPAGRFGLRACQGFCKPSHNFQRAKQKTPPSPRGCRRCGGFSPLCVRRSRPRPRSSTRGGRARSVDSFRSVSLRYSQPPAIAGCRHYFPLCFFWGRG